MQLKLALSVKSLVTVLLWASEFAFLLVTPEVLDIVLLCDERLVAHFASEGSDQQMLHHVDLHVELKFAGVFAFLSS